jgi:hypothetical protein
MKAWEIFWTLALLISSCAFALITLIVIVKGGPDLREMLRELRRQQPSPRDPHRPD